jgi:peptide/nickel transport system substrate-binding protein
MSLIIFNRIFNYLKLSTLLVLLLLGKATASINDTTLNHQKMVQIAVTDIPYSLSPYASDSLDLQYSHLFFDPLVRWGKYKNLEFRLLAKLKTLKNNKTRFYLKKNIYFHSGNLLTSNDVIWSLNEALKNKYAHRKLQHIIYIKRINEYQFDIQTKLTQDQLLDYLSHLFILDSVYYKKNNIDHNAAQVALSPPIKTLPLSGTGPYRVSSFYAGVNLGVQENVTYWQDPPLFKSLNFVKIKSIDSRLYALLAGDIDISEAIANEQINSVYLLDDKKIYQTSSSNALFLVINNKKNALFERETVRNAIHLTINQVGMLKHILNGTGEINNTLKIKISSAKEPIYDAKRAKYIFKKVNAPKILSLLVMIDKNTHTEQVVVALKNMFRKVGVELQITEVKTAARWNELQFKHDLMLSNWQTSLINIDNIYQSIFTNSTLSDYITLLFNQQKKSLTMQDKIKLFEQYQSLDYIIPLFSQNEIWATDKRFNLQSVFSVNAIPYWHLLTTNY